LRVIALVLGATTQGTAQVDLAFPKRPKRRNASWRPATSIWWWTISARALWAPTCQNFSVSVTKYVQDDVAGLRHLRALPVVDGKRIAQVGLSYGAMAGLRLWC